MFTIKNRMVPALIVSFVVVCAAYAQQSQVSTKTSRPDDEYVSEKGFKNRIFNIKYRDPESLLGVIRTLGSGFKGAAMSRNQEFKTLTVRDFPENIATIEEAIKRLDTPETPHPSIEFSIHMLIASNETVASSDYPAELDEVVKQLKATFKYKSYSLITSSIERAKEGGPGLNNKGVANGKLFNSINPQGRPIFYDYSLAPIAFDTSAPGPSTVQIGSFTFDMRVPLDVNNQTSYQSVGFRTPVSIREGEKVVVGTTTIGDSGIIVVLSTRIIS